MKHKHSEIIKAFVEGIECEYWSSCDTWIPFNDISVFNWVDKVRIKLEPIKEQYLYVYHHIDNTKTMMSPTLIHETLEWEYLGKVEVEK